MPVRLLPDQTILPLLQDANFGTIGPLTTLELQRAPLSAAERTLKRGMDLVLQHMGAASRTR